MSQKPQQADQGRLTDPIYAKVWRILGLPGPPPWVGQEDLSRYNAAGIQPNGARDVFITPEVARGIQSLPFSAGLDMDALRVLIHEYAHVAQPDMQKTRWIEGGAEEYARGKLLAVLQKLGVMPAMGQLAEYFGPATRYPGNVYPQYVRDVEARPDTEAFIEAGQFGRALGENNPSRVRKALENLQRRRT